MSIYAKTDGTPVQRDLWNVCAGAEVAAPYVNDHVTYIPKGHADHCSASLEVLSTLEYMAPMHCRVNDVGLMADPMTDEIFAKVEITQLFGESRDTLPKPPRPNMQHMIYPLAKPIHEPADLQQLSLTRSFLGMCSASDQFTTFKVIDFAEKNWTFKLMFRSEHQDYLMTDDWASFVREKSVQVGDVVVFLRDLISDKTRFSIRRGSVSVGRRHYLNLEAFSKAVGSLSQAVNTSITYYPGYVNSDFLVPARAFQQSLRLAWASGIRVTKLIDNIELQGTIVEAIFKRPVSFSSSLSRSMWKCLTVKWDESEALDKFSPWELSMKTERKGTMIFGVDLASSTIGQGTTTKKKPKRGGD